MPKFSAKFRVFIKLLTLQISKRKLKKGLKCSKVERNSYYHCVKVFKYGVFSDLYFLLFLLNLGIYSVNLRNSGQIRESTNQKILLIRTFFSCISYLIVYKYIWVYIQVSLFFCYYYCQLVLMISPGTYYIKPVDFY